MKYREVMAWTERGILERILTQTARERCAEIIVPNGDDSAVLAMGNQALAISVDSIVEKVDFCFDYFTPEQVGSKAIESAFSDIIAMGAAPRFALVALMLPHDCSDLKIEGINAGISSSSERLGVQIIGGDVSATAGPLTISVTALGTPIVAGRVLMRKGASVGDLIFVSAALGDSGAGLYALQRKYSGFEEIKRQHVMPHCRSDLVNEIAPIATAMIDISDGLASELRHICTASGCGARVYEDRIPVHSQTVELARRAGRNPYSFAYSGGEDYELLYTVAQESRDRAPGFCIGEIIEGSSILVCRNGRDHELDLPGFEHTG